MFFFSNHYLGIDDLLRQCIFYGFYGDVGIWSMPQKYHIDLYYRDTFLIGI